MQAAAEAGESAGAHGAVRAVVAVKSAAAEETLALPTLAEGLAGAPAPAQVAPAAAFAAALFSAEADAAQADRPGAAPSSGDDPWSAGTPAAAASPRRRTASFTPPATPMAQVSRRQELQPGRGEWSGPEGGAAASDAAIRPEPIAATRGEEPRPPRSDASVMALLMRPEVVAAPSVDFSSADFSSSGRSAAASSASWGSLPFPPPEAAAASEGRSVGAGGDASAVNPLAHRKLLSATMQLFVRNFGDVDHLDLGASGVTEHEEQARASRAVKLTLLSWVLIGLIVATAASFLVYRKTRLVQQDVDDGTALLTGDDLRGAAGGAAATPAAPRRGAVAVSVDPADAVVLLHVGDTPATVGDLDLGRAHLLRLEREGYAAVERTLTPAEITAGQPVAITLQPTGAGADQATVGTVPEGPSAGRRGTVSVTSDPPGATLWLAVGRGQAELPEVPIARYYFKIMRSGYQVAFVSLSEAQFEEGGGTAREAVSLTRLEEPAPAATPAGTPTVARPQRPVARVRETVPRARPAPTPARPRPAPVERKRPVRARRSLTLPSWAN
ncbi:MAG: hypothetical protein IPG96_08865 [Proteobacteria bacterium]|nr:hypothetical protein [Pseudomonadota bacterium]